MCEVPFLSHILPRDRFELIFWLLHVGLPQSTQPERKITKVKPLLDLLISTFQNSFDVGFHVAIYETMVGFCSRFGAKQYMPKNQRNGASKLLPWQIAARDTCVANILMYMEQRHQNVPDQHMSVFLSQHEL